MEQNANIDSERKEGRILFDFSSSNMQPNFDKNVTRMIILMKLFEYSKYRVSSRQQQINFSFSNKSRNFSKYIFLDQGAIEYHSIIADVFNGKLTSSVQCLACQRVNQKTIYFTLPYSTLHQRVLQQLANYIVILGLQ